MYKVDVLICAWSFESSGKQLDYILVLMYILSVDDIIA